MTLDWNTSRSKGLVHHTFTEEPGGLCAHSTTLTSFCSFCLEGSSPESGMTFCFLCVSVQMLSYPGGFPKVTLSERTDHLLPHRSMPWTGFFLFITHAIT